MKRISPMILALLAAILFLFTSCAQEKTLRINGVDTIVEPYGWADYQTKKVEGVLYEVNAGNIFLSIIFSETLVVPIWLTGWQFYEPIKIKENGSTTN